MASKLLNATSEFQDSRGQWFMGHDPLITLPGQTGADNLCYLTVPYAHHLLQAIFAAADVDTTGNNNVALYQADDGDAKAGAWIADFSATPVPDSGGTVAIGAFTLINAHKLATAGARTYWLKLNGTDSGDLVHRPQLSILVEPVTRSTL